MARQSDKDRVQLWQSRVNASNKIYEEWDKEYACDLLEEYYYGKQYQNDEDELAKRKYVINMFFPAVNIDKPSMLFWLPKYKVTPKPTRIDDAFSDVEARARLQQDTLQTKIDDPDLGFALETGLAFLDAQFRFGVVEVGYTADFMDNPNAGKPILKENSEDPLQDREGNPILQPAQIMQSENAYIKWIDAKQVRVSVRAKNRTESCDWFAYFEWHYTEDLKRDPRYKNTTTLQPTGRAKSENTATTDPEHMKNAGTVKVWKLWDLRARKRYVFVEGGEKFLLEEPYRTFPFEVLIFYPRLREWYPLPPSYNWVHPQNQLNEIREMRRVHRARAKRRYTAHPSVEQPELDKLAEDEDMTIIRASQADAINPIPDAPLDAAVFKDSEDAKQDFTVVSGVSGESRQVAESETATQANLIALQGRVRQSAKQMVVAEWLSRIGRKMLQIMRDHMALPFWIKIAVDPYSPTAGQEAQAVEYLWKQITAEQLGDADNDVSVEMASLSPISEEQERTNWIQFLSIATNPALQMVLGRSPTLLRKTAHMFGIKSERDIREIANALMQSMLMTAMMGAAPKGAPSGPSAPAPGPTPTNTDIAGQLSAQLPVEMVQ